MADSFRLKVISPEKTIFEGEVTFVQAPGKKGSFGLLKNHAPFLVQLEKGLLHFRPTKTKPEKIVVEAGFLSFRDNLATVLSG